jgi:D-alanyl-D-alanine carboxypeptidase (penicillin-binding protein 5/6)
MSLKENTKEKILALLTVVLLFLFVGILFVVISINNKEKTTALRNRVLKIRADKEIAAKLNQIQLATSTAPELTSKSFLTMVIADNNTRKILTQKNTDEILPIASITKLMTAIVILENIKLETEIKATRDYIGLEESAFVLETDKIYTAKELLANMLISSDNDSARLLSSTLGEINFIAKMNLKAKELGLTKTNYFNVTGLDPAKSSNEVNVSSVNDLANLLVYIKNKHPKILELTTNPSYSFCDINNFCKTVISTDKFLSDKDFKFKIIGGKTGSTDLAQKNLALIIEPIGDIMIINIILGAKDNFVDTASLINNITINK